MMSPHGIPVDLLDRLVIIRTLQYVLEEIIAILNTRAKVSPAAHHSLATFLVMWKPLDYLLHGGFKHRLLETPDHL